LAADPNIGWSNAFRKLSGVNLPQLPPAEAFLWSASVASTQTFRKILSRLGIFGFGWRYLL
jgi:hypothetical protein